MLARIAAQGREDHSLTYVISYNDGKPTQTFTNCGALQVLGSGTLLRFHGTRDGVTKWRTIPMRRIEEIN